MSANIKALGFTFAIAAGGLGLMQLVTSWPTAPEEGDIRQFSRTFDDTYNMTLERHASAHFMGGEQYAKTLQVTFEKNSADISTACVLDSYDFYGLFSRDVSDSPIVESYVNQRIDRHKAFIKNMITEDISEGTFPFGTYSSQSLNGDCGADVIVQYQDEMIQIANQRTAHILELN